MFKEEKGSITIMAFVVMLFISLYGALILANSARKYQIQTNNIQSIITSYKYQGTDEEDRNAELTQQELERIYQNVGGMLIQLN